MTTKAFFLSDDAPLDDSLIQSTSSRGVTLSHKRPERKETHKNRANHCCNLFFANKTIEDSDVPFLWVFISSTSPTLLKGIQRFFCILFDTITVMDQGTMIDLQSPMFMDDVYNPSTRSNNVVLMWLQDKKGTTFYGLGDSRQMVIMMSLFSLCVTGPVLLVIIKIDFYIALDSIFSIFCALLPLLTAMCSLLGAVRYDPRLVAINVLWHICTYQNPTILLCCCACVCVFFLDPFLLSLPEKWDASL